MADITAGTMPERDIRPEEEASLEGVTEEVEVDAVEEMEAAVVGVVVVRRL